jgi:hypothetical protein
MTLKYPPRQTFLRKIPKSDTGSDEKMSIQRKKIVSLLLLYLREYKVSNLLIHRTKEIGKKKIIIPLIKVTGVKSFWGDKNICFILGDNKQGFLHLFTQKKGYVASGRRLKRHGS